MFSTKFFIVRFLYAHAILGFHGGWVTGVNRGLVK